LLVAANAVATLLRFVLFRGWVFRSGTPSARALDRRPAETLESVR
jgi:hypothetical protein